MGCHATRIGGVAEYFVAAEKNSVRRRQRLRNDDGPSFEPRDQLLFLDIPDDAEPLYSRGEVAWSDVGAADGYHMGITLEKADFMGLARILRVK